MPDWSRSALVFPGQGSQSVGMGADLTATYPLAAHTFDEANTILGFDLSSICFNGPEAQLNDTVNTQPALYVMGIALLRVLQTACPDAIPAMVAGHSLGELTALTACGALDFADGVRLVQARGKLMAEAGEKRPGAMAALLGLDVDKAREACEAAAAETGKTLVVANDNCPGQVVISGDSETLEIGMTLAKAAGAKRAVRLAVSIAAHSPLMASAAQAFSQAVAQTPLKTPKVPIVGNISAAPLKGVEDIREALARQLTQAVRWTETIRIMRAAGITHFLELGPKDVLCGLIKRIDREATGVAVNSAAAVNELLGE